MVNKFQKLYINMKTIKLDFIIKKFEEIFTDHIFITGE